MNNGRSVSYAAALATSNENSGTPEDVRIRDNRSSQSPRNPREDGPRARGTGPCNDLGRGQVETETTDTAAQRRKDGSRHKRLQHTLCMSHRRQRWHLCHVSRKTSRSAPDQPWPDSVTDVTSGNAEPGDDTLPVSSHDEHPPVRGKCGASVTGVGGVGPGSEPGPRRLCLGVPQSDEPVSLPPAGQQSSVCGGVKGPMCGFPSKQYLELRRRVSVRAGRRGRAVSRGPFAGGCRADRNVWLALHLISQPEGAAEQEQVLQSWKPAMTGKGASETKHAGAKRDRKVEHA